MCVIADYLSARKLQLCVTKTASTAFHLNEKGAKRQLAVTATCRGPLSENPCAQPSISCVALLARYGVSVPHHLYISSCSRL